MINVPNAIPSTLMIESYNNKIKKLLKYGNLSTLTWVVLGDNTPGETDVVITLPTGNTKTVTINRVDISATLGANEFNVTELNSDLYDNVEDISEIQRAVAEASNLNIKNNTTLYSESFAMSVLLWVTKSVYVPPQDIVLTKIVKAVGDVSPVQKLLTISDDSLGYVGSVIIETQSNSDAGGPTVVTEHDLSTMTNNGVPGTWTWASYSPDGWDKNYIIDYTVGNIGATLITLNKIQYSDKLITYVEDTTHDVPGEIAVVLKPGKGSITDKFIGELRVIIKDLGLGNQYGVSSIQNYSNDWFVETSYGHYTVSVPESTTNEDVIEMYNMLANSSIYNRIYLSDDVRNAYPDPRGRLLFEFDGDVMIVKPSIEAEFKQLVGVAYITVSRNTNPIQPVDVTKVLDTISPSGTYSVNHELSIDDINYNIIRSILNPVAFNPNHKLNAADLTIANDGSIATVVPTVGSESRVNVEVMLTIRSVVPTPHVLDLSTINGTIISEPDYSDPDYSVDDIVLGIINAKLVELGKGDVVIDLSSMTMRYQLDWDRWYITSDYAMLDAQLINSFSIKLKDFAPAVLRTDLSSMSNISKPGQMMIDKQYMPSRSINKEDMARIFASATVGTYVDESVDMYRAVGGEFDNGLATIKPGSAIKPGTVVGELKVMYVEYDENGTWLPKLNLSEITNVDQNGVWSIDLPDVITDDNYIVVANTVKGQIAKTYKVDTTSLSVIFADGVLSIEVDSTNLVDANGTLTVVANVTGAVPVSDNAVLFTVNAPAGEATDNLTLKAIISDMIQGNSQWKLWKDGKLIAASGGLIFDNNIELSDPYYNQIAVTFKPEFFLGKTVTIAMDGNGEIFSLTNDGQTGDLTRTITVDKFHGVMPEQRLSVIELISVPETLPVHITSCANMFSECKVFNQDISAWDVSRVTKMNAMFSNALLFNQNIGGWDVSNVTEFSVFLSDAAAFDQDLSGWCVSTVTEEPYSFTSLPVNKRPRWGLCPSGPLTSLTTFDLSALKQGAEGAAGSWSITSTLSGGVDANKTALAQEVIDGVNLQETQEYTLEDFNYVEQWGYLKLSASQASADKISGMLLAYITFNEL